MTPQDPNLDPLLEQALAEIRDEPIDPAVIEAAAARVEAQLAQHTPLHNCADFQALIPAYREGKLSPARAPPAKGSYARMRSLLQGLTI